jgi:ribosomal protein S6--L-glutamate ligase
MRRQAVAGEFRSNLHRGGTATQVRLPEEYRKTALAAARVLGLRLAGVDMLESKEGPMIMEVNSTPGLEGIEKATGADIAGAVIEHLEREVVPAQRV